MKRISNFFKICLFITAITIILLLVLAGNDANKSAFNAVAAIFFISGFISALGCLYYFIFEGLFRHLKLTNPTVTGYTQNNKKVLLKRYFQIIEFPFYGSKNKESEEKLKLSWNNLKNTIKNKKIKNKIVSTNIYLSSNGLCRLFIYLTEELLDNEKEELLDYVFKENNEKASYIDLSKVYKEVINIFKKETKKECMEINMLNEDPNIKDNKFGGIPYIPIGSEIPKDSNGNDMMLLIQINLKDINLKGYPKKGILEIFYSVLDELPNFKSVIFEDNKDYRTDLVDNMPEEAIFTKPYKIDLKNSSCYMSTEDYKFSETFDNIFKKILNIETDDDLDSTLPTFYKSKTVDLTNLYEELGEPKLTIGGYPNFAQSDPRSYSNDYLNKDECLLKIDSSYDFEKIYIGDAGMIWAFISKEDLKNSNFDNVIIDWDCF